MKFKKKKESLASPPGLKKRGELRWKAWLCKIMNTFFHTEKWIKYCWANSIDWKTSILQKHPELESLPLA